MYIYLIHTATINVQYVHKGFHKKVIQSEWYTLGQENRARAAQSVLTDRHRAVHLPTQKHVEVLQSVSRPMSGPPIPTTLKPDAPDDTFGTSRTYKESKMCFYSLVILITELTA